MTRSHCKQRISCLGILALLLIGLLSACGKNASRTQNATPPDSANSTYSENSTQASTQPVIPTATPELGRIRQICELVTVECTYHNVAKSTKSPGIGLEHIGETERVFWIEYTATAEISYDINKIQMDINESEITITLPRPKVSCKVDPESWNENSYVISQDQLFQKNPITAADQTNAINLAQAEMIQQIRGNSSLMNTARLQAQELIKNYIDQIGEFTGVQYHITWKDAESGS
ncbi:MAG: DUF4230 domain-containing protein [Lachnospiraceae bacterium]|nr:DUF4230 domain-containing protein [Lachnospiraceae bacterium]